MKQTEGHTPFRDYRTWYRITGDLAAGIAGSRWTVFEESSHLPHVAERARYMRVVADFLDQD